MMANGRLRNTTAPVTTCHTTCSEMPEQIMLSRPGARPKKTVKKNPPPGVTQSKVEVESSTYCCCLFLDVLSTNDRPGANSG